jgi:hypothetical protein
VYVWRRNLASGYAGMIEGMDDGPDSKRDVSDSDEWHFLTRYPPGEIHNRSLVDLYRRLISDAEIARPNFGWRLRLACLQAITSDSPKVIRQGVQFLSLVGSDADV